MRIIFKTEWFANILPENDVIRAICKLPQLFINVLILVFKAKFGAHFQLSGGSTVEPIRKHEIYRPNVVGIGN